MVRKIYSLKTNTQTGYEIESMNVSHDTILGTSHCIKYDMAGNEVEYYVGASFQDLPEEIKTKIAPDIYTIANTNIFFLFSVNLKNEITCYYNFTSPLNPETLFINEEKAYYEANNPLFEDKDIFAAFIRHQKNANGDFEKDRVYFQFRNFDAENPKSILLQKSRYPEACKTLFEKFSSATPKPEYIMFVQKDDDEVFYTFEYDTPEPNP